MTVLQCSIVLGMKIWEHCKVYSLLDVNNIYSITSYMDYLTLEFICAKDENIGHSVTCDIKSALVPSVWLELKRMTRAQ